MFTVRILSMWPRAMQCILLKQEKSIATALRLDLQYSTVQNNADTRHMRCFALAVSRSPIDFTRIDSTRIDMNTAQRSY